MSVPTHQTRILYMLGDLCLTTANIAEEIEGATRHQISMATSALVKKGLVERVETGCFQLTAGGHAMVSKGETITSGPNGPTKVDRKPLRDTLRQRAWNVMRITHKFTIPDLMVSACRGEEKLAQNNLQRFCNVLVKAGVLRRLPSRQVGYALSSPGFNRYCLMNDLGPIAPSYRDTAKTLFDHNSSEELPCG